MAGSMNRWWRLKQFVGEWGLHFSEVAATLIENVFLNPIEKHSYKWLFTAANMIQWYFYDERQHAYISHVFQKDKYGVVINYMLLGTIKLFLTRSYTQRQITQSQSQPDVNPQHVARLNRQIQHQAFFTFAKMVMCNFIFMNNTYAQLEKGVTAQQMAIRSKIHLTCVGLLGLFSLASESSFTVHPNPQATGFYFMKVGVIAAAFKYFRDWAEADTNSPLWIKGCSVFFESWLAQESI